MTDHRLRRRPQGYVCTGEKLPLFGRVVIPRASWVQLSPTTWVAAQQDLARLLGVDPHHGDQPHVVCVARDARPIQFVEMFKFEHHDAVFLLSREVEPLPTSIHSFIPGIQIDLRLLTSCVQLKLPG